MRMAADRSGQHHLAAGVQLLDLPVPREELARGSDLCDGVALDVDRAVGDHLVALAQVKTAPCVMSRFVDMSEPHEGRSINSFTLKPDRLMMERSVPRSSSLRSTSIKFTFCQDEGMAPILLQWLDIVLSALPSDRAGAQPLSPSLR